MTYGSTDMTYDDRYLIDLVAQALRNSGSTCDEDNWSDVMAREAVMCLRLEGALK